jgi:Ni,Fe-hydrogenase III large subunit
MKPTEGAALGFCEGWRGPVLYWVRLGRGGVIERCKIVDASFNNWQGLAYAVPGNIIPDFPLCNKSFNLSYPGNDL